MEEKGIFQEQGRCLTDKNKKYNIKLDIAKSVENYAYKLS